MPIRRHLEDTKLTPDEVKRLSRAYDCALRSLHLVDRNDPVTKIIAKKVIEIGATVRDPKEICEVAVRQLRG